MRGPRACPAAPGSCWAGRPGARAACRRESPRPRRWACRGAPTRSSGARRGHRCTPCACSRPRVVRRRTCGCRSSIGAWAGCRRSPRRAGAGPGRCRIPQRSWRRRTSAVDAPRPSAGGRRRATRAWCPGWRAGRGRSRPRTRRRRPRPGGRRRPSAARTARGCWP